MAFTIVLCDYAIIGHIRVNQLLPQLLMDQFDTFPIQCVYNVDTLKICMKELSLEKINFDKMTAVRT